jgi:predicted transcriptional regulator
MEKTISLLLLFNEPINRPEGLEIRARRSKDQIVLEILRICANGENVTKIVYQTNTNFTTIKSYMNLLMKNDLIECLGISPRIYKSTAKGIDMMNRLKQLQGELKELTV